MSARRTRLDEAPTLAEAKTAVIYARCSTRQQDPSSIDRQLDVCKTFAAERGLRVVGEFCDRDISGDEIRRPAFNAMFDLESDLEFDVILIESADRLSRSALVTIAAYDAATMLKVRIVDVDLERNGPNDLDRIFVEIEKCDRCRPIARKILLKESR